MLMGISGTHIAYYHICRRKLWLFSNGITMEHTSDLVKEGKLIAENTYLDRSRKYTELQLGNIRVDFYDARNKVIHEVKKSDSLDLAHVAQVKYYLYRLFLVGINGATGILEYPKLRHQEQVLLSNEDIESIKEWEKDIEQLCNSEKCPPTIHSKICRSCSYYDFCYIEED